MKRMKRTGLTLTISVFLLLTLFMTLSIAGEREGAVTVTPNIGGYFFEGDQNIDDGITYGLNLGYSLTENWGLEGSFNYINSEKFSQILRHTDVRGYLYKLDGLYNITNFGKLVPYLAAGVGAITLDPRKGASDTDFLVNYGAGLKYFITDDIALRGDVRHVLPFGNSQNNLLCTVGLSFLFGGTKETPKVEEAPKAVETPKAAETPKTDSDGDGVYDDLDKCPDTPKDVKVDADGCPLDTDGDGVYDYLDKCPDTPKGVKVDADGCPLDTDGDGVYDYLDKCPGTPKGAGVDSRGCWVLGGVFFDTEKWNILSQYFPVLDNVVTIIKKNPAMKLEIQGHTDSRGTEKYNQKLSENRANAVLQYIAGKGVDRSNLTAKGFGFSVPAAPNDTVEGMAKNRRVELQPVF